MRSIPRKATTTTMTQRGQLPGNAYGNAIAHARQQLAFGQSANKIDGQLARKYPSLTTEDIRQALLTAQSAMRLAAKLQSGQIRDPRLIKSVPINPGIPSQYQYVVSVT